MIHCAPAVRPAGRGGAPVPAPHGPTLGGGWGMTETSPAGTNLPLEGTVEAGLDRLALAGSSSTWSAIDDPRRVLPPGETGELRIKGRNVTQGYWNRPRRRRPPSWTAGSSPATSATWTRTAIFFIVDRRKDMIISGGFNVYPQMIEQADLRAPAGRRSIVLGVPDAYRGEAAKVFVTLKTGARRFTLDELQAFLADKIGRHEMPAALEFRESLPRTPVGKLSQVELREDERRAYDLSRLQTAGRGA